MRQRGRQCSTHMRQGSRPQQKLEENAIAALEAEKVESAALRQVIEGAKLALKQAETALKEERRAVEAANREAAAVRRELAVAQESFEQAQSARANDRRDVEAALATAEGDRDAARRDLQSVRDELETARRELDDIRRDADARAQTDSESHARHDQAVTAANAAARTAETRLEETTRERDAAHNDLETVRAELDGIRRELDGVRHDADARALTLSQSQNDQELASHAAHELARNAEARLEQAIRDREAAQSESAELKRQLEAVEAAVRESEAVNRELQAAHEARDAAEVEAARTAERRLAELEAESEADVVVDLTSIAQEEEKQLAIERRIRALELALRDAETRAESAEQELERHRLSAAGEPSGNQLETAAPAEVVTAAESSEQFRGPSRGARRVSFRADIAVQIDGNPGKLVDLSMTGAQVLTPAAINPNRLVSVTLPLGDSALSCKAKVAWSRLEPRSGQLWYRAGVQFTTADQQGLESFFAMHQT